LTDIKSSAVVCAAAAWEFYATSHHGDERPLQPTAANVPPASLKWRVAA